MHESGIPASKTIRERKNDAVRLHRRDLGEELRKTINRVHQNIRRLQLRETSTRREMIASVGGLFMASSSDEIWPAHPADRYHEAFLRIVKGRTAIGCGDETTARHEAEAVYSALEEDANADAHRLRSYALELQRDLGGAFGDVDALCAQTCLAAHQAKDYVGAAHALVTHANLVRMNGAREAKDRKRILNYLKFAEDLIKGPGRRQRRAMADVSQRRHVFR